LINLVVLQLKELEDEWEKVGPGAQAKQARFMRSQQDLREKMEAKAASVAGSAGGGNFCYCYFSAVICYHTKRETPSFNPYFSPVYIGDGRIASSMAVYHSTIFCYWTYWNDVTL